jgi:hypothetical protein
MKSRTDPSAKVGAEGPVAVNNDRIFGVKRKSDAGARASRWLQQPIPGAATRYRTVENLYSAAVTGAWAERNAWTWRNTSETCSLVSFHG